MINSPKGGKLIKMYQSMAENGYDRADGTFVPADDTYASFELLRYHTLAEQVLKDSNTVLDYGCGASNWSAQVSIEGTAIIPIDYFNLSEVFRYEPARGLDERQNVDTVVCFDVLEHLFIADVASTLRDIYKYATKSVFLNIAGYEAQALLPNGENAHTVVRPITWWKGVLDLVSLEFPDVETHFLFSTKPGTGQYLSPWKAKSWIDSDKFVINL